TAADLAKPARWAADANEAPSATASTALAHRAQSTRALLARLSYSNAAHPLLGLHRTRRRPPRCRHTSSCRPPPERATADPLCVSPEPSNSGPVATVFTAYGQAVVHGPACRAGRARPQVGEGAHRDVPLCAPRPRNGGARWARNHSETMTLLRGVLSPISRHRHGRVPGPAQRRRIGHHDRI